jgi:hypothetical protein
MVRSGVLSRVFGMTALGAVLIGSLALAPSAQAYVSFSFGFPFFVGPPAYYPPPPYYPPPAYYPPPPATYAPPVPQPGAPSGQSCYAGAYVCPMEHPVPSGSSCYCLSNNRTRIPGQAN